MVFYQILFHTILLHDNIASKLERRGRILIVIQKAELKGLNKNKIISYLINAGVSESKIIEAYKQYYNEEGLYEIKFDKKPFGFSIITGINDTNAIVSAIQDENYKKLGLKVASRIHKVNNIHVYGKKFDDILEIIAHQQLPINIVFKESQKKKQVVG